MKNSTFVKISWDLIDKKEVLEYLKGLSEKSFLVICTWWWSQINEEFRKRWFEIAFWALGREIKSFEWRQLARNILEINQAAIQDSLFDKWIKAEVVIPVIDIWSVLCHINWDIFALNAYNSFDEIFIFTLKDRIESKTKYFEKYEKIKIIWF